MTWWIIASILVLAAAFICALEWAVNEFASHKDVSRAIGSQPHVRTISFLQNDDRQRALDRIVRAEAWLRAICSQNGHDYDAGPDEPECGGGRYVPGDEVERERERERFMQANGFRTFKVEETGAITASDDTCYPGEDQRPLPFDRNDPHLRK